MSTTTVKTIGASGADYSTLQAWEDASPANLTTSIGGGEIWEGRIKDASDAFSSATTILTISGSTTDATGFKRLTTAAGASFRDNASVQSNALRFNASNGCAITNTGNYVQGIILDENYAQISKIQVSATGTSGTAMNTGGNARTNNDIDGCIFEATGNMFGSQQYSGKVRNTLVVLRAASGSEICKVGFGTSEFYNCTFAVPSDLAAATNCFSGNHGTITLQNCAFFGVSALKTGNGTYGFTTCMTDATGTTGVTGGKTYANQFQNTANATRDFRLKTGADCIDAGTTDSTNAATDIAGTARPSGSSYDVGAWEFVSAGGGGGTGTGTLGLLGVGS